MSGECRICGRREGLNGTGDLCLRPTFTDTDEVAATCYRLGYERARRSLTSMLELISRGLLDEARALVRKP